MKLKYQAQKRTRINYRFMGFTTFEYGWWFVDDSKSWVKNPQGGGYSSHQPCRSVRAFRRKLKKAPDGVEFFLVSRWKGYDVKGVGTKVN